MENRSFYNEILTEHNIHPEFKHDIPAADIELAGVNPSCGDNIVLKLKTDGDVITDGGFVGERKLTERRSARVRAVEPKACFFKLFGGNHLFLRFFFSVNIDLFDLLGVFFVDPASFHLQRIGQFPSGDGKRFRQEDEAFHLFIVCEVLLQEVDAVFNHLVDFR